MLLLRYDFEPFSVHQDAAGGLLLARSSDGADVYFQPGDDAARFDRECEAIEARGVNDRARLACFSLLSQYFSAEG